MTAPAYPAVESAAHALAAAGLDVCVRPGCGGRPVVHIDHVRGTFTLEVYANGEMCLWASGCEAPAYWGDGNAAAVVAAVRSHVDPDAAPTDVSAPYVDFSVPLEAL